MPHTVNTSFSQSTEHLIRRKSYNSNEPNAILSKLNFSVDKLTRQTRRNFHNCPMKLYFRRKKLMTYRPVIYHSRPLFKQITGV